MITSQLVNYFGFGWVSSLLTFYFIVSLIVFFLIRSIIFTSNRFARVSFFISIFSVVYVSFQFNPIYQHDLEVGGKQDSNVLAKTFENSFLDSLASKYPNYTGLVMLAITNCEYCKNEKKRLSILKQNAPKLDVLVVVLDPDLQKKSNHLFLNIYKLNGLDYVISSGFDEVLPINKGGFPHLLYFNNGVLNRSWGNDEFGLASLDWLSQSI